MRCGALMLKLTSHMNLLMLILETHMNCTSLPVLVFDRVATGLNSPRFPCINTCNDSDMQTSSISERKTVAMQPKDTWSTRHGQCWSHWETRNAQKSEDLKTEAIKTMSDTLFAQLVQCPINEFKFFFSQNHIFFPLLKNEQGPGFQLT
jgi:hypothetical protein